jgi:hypothetical protein
MVAASTKDAEPTAIRPDGDPRLVLADCCEQKASCRFQLVHCDYLVRATFVAVHDEWVELQVFWNPGDERIHTQAICCVSFPFGNTCCAFLGCVIDVRHPQPGEIRVFAAIPKQLMVSNLRHKFRVPIVEQAGLETIVRTSQKREFPVIARDITEQSMEVEFAPTDDHGLSVGAMVQIELRFRKDDVQKMAEVRRITGLRCGLSFCGSQEVNGQHTDARLHSLVVSLQQVWLKNRLS